MVDVSATGSLSTTNEDTLEIMKNRIKSLKEFQSTKFDGPFDPQDPAEEAECWRTHLLEWTEAHRGSEEEMGHQPD